MCMWDDVYGLVLGYFLVWFVISVDNQGIIKYELFPWLPSARISAPKKPNREYFGHYYSHPFFTKHITSFFIFPPQNSYPSSFPILVNTYHKLFFTKSKTVFWFHLQLPSFSCCTTDSPKLWCCWTLQGSFSCFFWLLLRDGKPKKCIHNQKQSHIQS